MLPIRERKSLVDFRCALPSVVVWLTEWRFLGLAGGRDRWFKFLMENVVGGEVP